MLETARRWVIATAELPEGTREEAMSQMKKAGSSEFVTLIEQALAELEPKEVKKKSNKSSDSKVPE